MIAVRAIKQVIIPSLGRINYLNNFLPTLMDDDSTKNIILDHIKENNLENKDFGKIMGFLKQNYNNKIDMNLASKIIKHIFK